MNNLNSIVNTIFIEYNKRFNEAVIKAIAKHDAFLANSISEIVDIIRDGASID